MIRRVCSAVSRAGLVLASLIVALAAVEVALRTFSHVVPPLDVDDPVVGKIYLPGYAGTAYIDECDCNVYLRFNREGFRGPDRPYEKSAATRRIALIGDSMVAALATQEEQTAARLLEVEIEARFETPHQDGSATNRSRTEAASVSGTRWEVMNFGMSGASTAQELVLYRERVRRYAPDIVVLAFFLRNDVIDNSPRLGTSPRVFFDLDLQGTLFQLPVTTQPDYGRGWLNRHSRLYVWQKLMFARMHGRWGRLDRSRLVYVRAPQGDVAHAWTLTAELLRRFRNDVSRDGAQFVVAALVPAEVVYDDVWAELLSRAGTVALGFDRDVPEHRLAAICEAAGIELITMSDAFRAAAPHASSTLPDERLFWQGIGHFNDRGNELAARIIADRLTSVFSLDEPASQAGT